MALGLDLSVHRFTRAADRFLRTREQRLAALLARLETQSPLHHLQLKGQRLEHLRQRLRHSIAAILHTMQSRLAAAAALLHSVSPLATLGRGYAIVRKKEVPTGQWTVVADSGEVTPGDQVDVLLARGGLSCEVLATTPPAGEEPPAPENSADQH
jgi:exodeoxyribonuclease VII large subunit